MCAPWPLGCDAIYYKLQGIVLRVHWLTLCLPHCSKFFGKPDGSKPAPTQQTKLSFATKTGDKPKKQAAPKEEDDGSGDEVTANEAKAAVHSSPSSNSAKENSKPVQGQWQVQRLPNVC